MQIVNTIQDLIEQGLHHAFRQGLFAWFQGSVMLDDMLKQVNITIYHSMHTAYDHTALTYSTIIRTNMIQQ